MLATARRIDLRATGCDHSAKAIVNKVKNEMLVILAKDEDKGEKGKGEKGKGKKEREGT